MRLAVSLAVLQGHTYVLAHVLEREGRNRELGALNSHSKCCQTVREGREEGRGERRGGHYITVTDVEAKLK